jgi:hypothetical protein
VVKDSGTPYYRGCWHEVSLPLTLFYIHYIQKKPVHQKNCVYNIIISSSNLCISNTETCWIALVCIVQDSLLLPLDVQALLQARCGRSLFQACYVFQARVIKKAFTTTYYLKPYKPFLLRKMLSILLKKIKSFIGIIQTAANVLIYYSPVRHQI